jgi:hypothetical protein
MHPHPGAPSQPPGCWSRTRIRRLAVGRPPTLPPNGGFADASFWGPVIKELQAHDLPALAPPNPLRGLAHDAEYIASYVNQIDGPVLPVGHAYGGAVISAAGASTPNAVGLVYVAAFALDEGESFAEIFARFGDTPLVGAVRPSTYPLPNGQSAVELTIAPELYREAFAADLPAEITEVAAVSQRPFAAIFDDRAEAAACKTLPSWALVAAADKAIPPEAERRMARRAGPRRSRSRRHTRSPCRSRGPSPTSSGPRRTPPPPSRPAADPTPGLEVGGLQGTQLAGLLDRQLVDRCQAPGGRAGGQPPR